MNVRTKETQISTQNAWLHAYNIVHCTRKHNTCIMLKTYASVSDSRGLNNDRGTCRLELKSLTFSLFVQ